MMAETQSLPTMTIVELRHAMQMLGIKISHETLAAAIEQGVYPFASCFIPNGSTRRKYIISRKKFREWVSDFIGEDLHETV